MELAYALEASCWGQGLATGAALAALQYGFAVAGLERIVAIACETNVASVGVLHKLGMPLIGVAEYLGAEWAKYELAAAEWRAEQKAARLPLSTERLELRRFIAADLEPLQSVFDDPEVMRFVGADRRPPATGEVVVSQTRVDEHWTEHRLGPSLSWSGPQAGSSARPARTWSSRTRSRAPPGLACPGSVASLHVLEKLGMAPVGPRDCCGSRLTGHELTLGE